MKMRTITTKDDFDQLLASSGMHLLTVLFTAKWCEPCKTVGSKYRDMEREHSNVIMTIIDVDVDESPDIAQDCGVTGLPTVQFYRSTIKLDEVVGNNIPRLEEAFQKYTS